MFFNPIRTFFQLEAASGLLLFLTALIALFFANSPFASFYQQLQQHLQFPVNEGLMTLFFLLVGLELKREFLQGQLREFKQMLLPVVSGLGGMIVPALIYVLVNHATSIGLKGWGIPVATDIAFALGVLSLFGRKVPTGLKLFLMALAIFDDIGAVLIIAFFNTQAVSFIFLVLALLLVGSLGALNRLGVLRLLPYVVLGGLLWFCLLKGGIHPTIAGVLLALFIPSRPLPVLESRLHPWVAYGVMPLFSLLNAGLSFQGITFSHFFDSVTLGIILGLFFGKQVGVMISALLLIHGKRIPLPAHTSWLELYGVALLCGIGFTMSLFLGTLAFAADFPAYLPKVRLGVLTGSLLSGLVGAAVLHIAFRINKKM